MHMAAARLGYKGDMVGTGYAISCPGSTYRLKNHYSGLVGVHLW